MKTIAGVDEVGRGSLIGPVYAAAVILNKTINKKLLKDSKSLKKNKTEISTLVAENLAKKAQEKKITKVYFDRGIYKYHGRIKIFAETLRKNGLEF